MLPTAPGDVAAYALHYKGGLRSNSSSAPNEVIKLDDAKLGGSPEPAESRSRLPLIYSLTLN
jgi:hypothetical protein